MKDLIKLGQKYYTNCHLRHQWIRKTLELKASGKHASQTGGFRRGMA